MPSQVKELSVVKEVKIGFWQTTYGILIKRLFFNALATVLAVVYDQLVTGNVNVEALRYVLATQLVYVLLTLSRDLADPKLPNHADTVVVK